MIEEKQLTTDEASAAREKAADEAAALRYLEPGDFEVFELDGAYRLTLPHDRSYLKFAAHRTYPLSHPEKYISLRSGINGMEEIGIIRDLRQFDKRTQHIIRQLLDRRYFTPRVTKIIGTKERYGGMVWNMETDRGAKTIVTKGLHEALSENSVGCYFITDVEGNRYEVVMEELSQESAAWIQRVI